MGSFIGHIMPGVYLFLLSLWWTISIFSRYFTRHHKNETFCSSTYYSFGCCGRKFKKFPLDPVIRIAMACVGISVQIIATSHGGGKKDIQHATMYFFFGIAGIVDMFYQLKWPLPDGLNYCATALAFSIEGLLFKFHLHGRETLDVTIHTLLVYSITACALATITEMVYRNNVVVALSRTYFMFLQATWFWQIAFILYNPLPSAEEWNKEDHEIIMLAVAIFAWHCGALLIFMCLIGTIVYQYHQRSTSKNNEVFDVNKPLIFMEMYNEIKPSHESDGEDY